MRKICQVCDYVAESPMEQQEPPGIPENCPQCGGLGTVVDEVEVRDEKPDEDEK